VIKTKSHKTEQRLYAMPEVAEMLNISVSAIKKLVSQRRFPPPIEFTPYLKRWKKEDLDDVVAGKYALPKKRPKTELRRVKRA
jgi:predicted DNA-binding transcriptional regulator AlpA